MSGPEATEKQRRTESARMAAARTFARRRESGAMDEVEGQGYRAPPPIPPVALVFDGDGVLRDGRGNVQYRCAGCGRGSWYVRAADRFYHSDGTDNTLCFRAMHRGTNPYPFPKIQGS